MTSEKKVLLGSIFIFVSTYNLRLQYVNIPKEKI